MDVNMINYRIGLLRNSFQIPIIDCVAGGNISGKQEGL